MNKEELIKKLEITQSFYKTGYRVDRYTDGYIQGLEAALMFIDQLDEPEQTDIDVGLLKPTVPQFVAEWIEKCKTKGKTLNQAYSDLDVENVNVIKWIYHEGDRNGKVNLFARAWLDGYTVEEKKYYVKFTDYEHSYLNRLNDGELIVSDFTKKLCLFTEQEINAIDPRYMAFAEEATE